MQPAALVLLANADRWLLESLESVLTQGGYRVVTTDRRPQVLARARELRPDAIILDVGLGTRGSDGFGVCRSLRADPTISNATPIILTTVGPALRSNQLEALRAGAWELRGEPLDTEELVLRLGAYVHGKLEVERLNAEGLVDRASGLYNAAGIARRSEELAAFSARVGVALACAVFQPAEMLTSPVAGDTLALAIKHAGRISDAIGRTGPTEFTVFAPATDATAAEGLVQRITDTVAKNAAVKLKAGVSATDGAETARASGSVPNPMASGRRSRPTAVPEVLLERAREALGGPS